MHDRSDSVVGRQQRVSIVGAGPAGFALAVDLLRRGTNVLLYSHADHTRHIDSIKKRRHVKSGGLGGHGEIPRVTLDIGEVVDFSDIIILAVPSTGQDTVLQQLRHFALHRHTIIAVPGNLFSLTVNMNVACILETNLSPYSCRIEDGELIVMGKKKSIFIAALQRGLDQDTKQRVQDILPTELHWCSSVVEVSLLNVNGVFHPLMMLMNAGRVENTDGEFYLYKDGLTRSVANAMLAVDQVRIDIGKAFGLEMKTALQTSNECYNHNFTDLVDLAQRSGPHNKLRAPSSLDNRNISEDVPDLLVTWHSLAKKLGIDASPIEAIVVLVRMATGVDYFATGRNLEKLGLEDVSRRELLERFGCSTTENGTNAVRFNSSIVAGP